VRYEPNTMYLITKRVLDVVLGGILFILSVPLILLAALAVRLESPGNPFFVQVRVGLKGKKFKIFKLRGMYSDARDRFPDLYDYGRFEDLDFYFHYQQDPRITVVGRFLRRTSIDELPNFLNVVLGTMTLVGPRPEIPEVLRLYGECAPLYLAVKPGVTCLSKITGRDLLTKRESVNLDLEYIDNMSFLLDIRILWKTFRNVLLLRFELPKRQEFSDAKPPDRRATAPTQTD
jgi:lipopolysaccharide/colanic/teichoic acid biosynthesis glycosyltransferase